MNKKNRMLLASAPSQPQPVEAPVVPLPSPAKPSPQEGNQPAPLPAQAALEAQLAALQAENARLRASQAGKLTMKVSEKGAISIYGLARFPVTLYPTQLQRLGELFEDDGSGNSPMSRFVEANKDRLSWERKPGAPGVEKQASAEVSPPAAQAKPPTIRKAQGAAQAQ